MRSSVVPTLIFGLLASTAAIVVIVHLATLERRDPARCPHGLLIDGPRCCAPGQLSAGSACLGAPTACPPGMRLIAGERPGCAAVTKKVRYTGGRLRSAPSDWEAERAEGPPQAHVALFAIDSIELTNERALSKEGEPGAPRTNVTPEEAEKLCSFQGGRLPTSGEWLVAAAGTAEPRRFPWGATGLVCRRAAFGLVDGPCGEGATSPELAGARPDGATPQGALDLSGNVAEWTREPGGGYRARGGSFRSRVAGELKSWASEPLPAERRAPHIGFRCAYDID